MFYQWFPAPSDVLKADLAEVEVSDDFEVTVRLGVLVEGGCRAPPSRRSLCRISDYYCPWLHFRNFPCIDETSPPGACIALVDVVVVRVVLHEQFGCCDEVFLV